MRRATLDEQVHHLVHQHLKVGVTLLAVIIGLTLWRWAIYRHPELFVTAIYLDVALLATGLAGFQGWLGAELVYSHGVFVQQGSPGRPADIKPATNKEQNECEEADCRR